MIKFIGFVVIFALIFTPLAPISLFIAFGLIAPYSRMSEREKARNAATKKPFWMRTVKTITRRNGMKRTIDQKRKMRNYIEEYAV